MEQGIRSIISPLLSVALLMMANGYLMSFLSIRLIIEGFEESMVGYLHSAYYAGLLIGSVRVEGLIKRVGHIRSFATFGSICAASIMYQGFWDNPYAWIFMRFIAGICFAALWVVIESWLLQTSTVDTRGKILSYYMIALYTAQALGQYLLDVTNIYSMEPFFVAGLICSLSIVPVSVTYFQSPPLNETKPFSVIALVRASPFGYLGCVLAGVIISSIISFAPNFAQVAKIPVSQLMSVTIIGGVILQWPIGKLSDIFDRRTILICVSFATMLPALAILFYPTNDISVLVLSFILGGFCFTIYPLSITQAVDRVDIDNITVITGVLLFAYGIGSVLGPLIAPLFMTQIGPIALFGFIAGSACILGVVGLYSSLFHPQVPAEDQGEYVPLPPTTPVAYDMDPRAPEENAE